MNKITLAPTSLPTTPPIEFIHAAASAGYDGLGMRLHRSPAYPNWVSWLDDEALKRDVKATLKSTGQTLVESLSYYIEPELDLEEMKPSLAYAADLGATYALVIGRDTEWDRQRDNFGRFVDTAASFGLITAIEAPVGTFGTMAACLKVIQECGRSTAVLCIDPTAFKRAGDDPEALRGVDPRLFPYTQITDSKPGQGRVQPGSGDAPVRELLDILPADIPLSLEWSAPNTGAYYSALEWACAALDGTRDFLKSYYASKQPAASR